MPKIGKKIKDKGEVPTGGSYKNMKAHKEPFIYTLTDDDMDRIGYQLKDVTEELV